MLALLDMRSEVRWPLPCSFPAIGGDLASALRLQGWNKQWDEWVEQEGLHKFKKELLDVRLDGGENSAQGTADAKCDLSPLTCIAAHAALALVSE